MQLKFQWRWVGMVSWDVGKRRCQCQKHIPWKMLKIAAFSIAFYFSIDVSFYKKRSQTPLLGHFYLSSLPWLSNHILYKTQPSNDHQPLLKLHHPHRPRWWWPEMKARVVADGFPWWWLCCMISLRSGVRWKIERATNILWHIFSWTFLWIFLSTFLVDPGIQESLNRASQIMVSTLNSPFFLIFLDWDRMV